MAPIGQSHAALRASGCSWLTSPVRKLSAAPWSTRNLSGGPAYDLIFTNAQKVALVSGAFVMYYRYVAPLFSKSVKAKKK